MFMVKHKMHHKILILIDKNFYGSIRPYKPYRVRL